MFKMIHKTLLSFSVEWLFFSPQCPHSMCGIHFFFLSLELCGWAPFDVICLVIVIIIRTVAATDLRASELDCLVVMCQPVEEQQQRRVRTRTWSPLYLLVQKLKTATESLHDEVRSLLLLHRGLRLCVCRTSLQKRREHSCLTIPITLKQTQSLCFITEIWLPSGLYVGLTLLNNKVQFNIDKNVSKYIWLAEYLKKTYYQR